MDWITGIQNALNYIEDNLTSQLDYAEIAQRACFSPFQFQRMFNALCGCTVGEYIRQRRLTLAGSELSSSDIKVIDAALKYCYDSPESFTRAFVRFHGITPSAAKKNSGALRSFSRLSVQIILKGGNLMNYRIEKQSAFKVMEKIKAVSIDDGVNKNTIPDFWEQSKQDGTITELCRHMTGDDMILGICYGNELKDAKEFDYSIAVKCDDDTSAPDGFGIREIPARTWAVFECIGAMPDAIQELWHRICSEFFPTSEYQPTFEFDIEVYPDGDMNSPDYKSEIWVPVTKK